LYPLCMIPSGASCLLKSFDLDLDLERQA
jgi:hypothetical protein